MSDDVFIHPTAIVDPSAEIGAGTKIWVNVQVREDARIGRYRWSICALLFCVITINYVDRQVIGVLKPIIEKDMRWSEVDYGNIVTAFQASYGVGLLVVGRWLDKVGTQRNEAQARELVRAAASEQRWIIEGVFGWLAEVALPSATALIWLDLPWSICRDGLAARGPWRDAAPEAHADFLQWAEDYWRRKTPSSFAGHLALYEGFDRFKLRLHDRSEITALVQSEPAQVSFE